MKKGGQRVMFLGSRKSVCQRAGVEVGDAGCWKLQITYLAGVWGWGGQG